VALLRASGEHAGENYDLSAVLGDSGRDTGIPDADVLIRLAEAVVGYDTDEIAAARQAVLDRMGAAALVDAAAVAANFNAIDRVADSIGIPLEEEKALHSEEFREELGINGFGKMTVNVASERHSS